MQFYFNVFCDAAFDSYTSLYLKYSWLWCKKKNKQEKKIDICC